MAIIKNIIKLPITIKSPSDLTSPPSNSIANVTADPKSAAAPNIKNPIKKSITSPYNFPASLNQSHTFSENVKVMVSLNPKNRTASYNINKTNRGIEKTVLISPRKILYIIMITS